MKTAMISLLVFTMLTMGCASKKFVGNEIEASETRTQQKIQDLERMVEETQTEIRDLAEELGVKIEGLAAETDSLEARAGENEEAIARMGHLSFRKTFSDAEAYFRSDSSELQESATAELDKFAELIKAQNRLVHLEIQGHTDSRGSENYNQILGQKRAESVRDYLYKNHDIPLHLMNVISMGSSDPVVSNDTRDGRAQNRRVVLVVRVKI